MLRLVIAHHDDLARGVREPAEPAADRLVRPPQRILGRCPDLVARRESQRRVVPQPGERGRHPGRAQHLGAEPGELAVDALGLLEPDGVDRLRREVQRRVGPDEMRVGRVAAGDVGEPGPVVRAGDRAQLVDQDRSLSLERRPDRRHGSRRARRRRRTLVIRAASPRWSAWAGRRQRPIDVVERKEIVQLVDHAVDEARPGQSGPRPPRSAGRRRGGRSRGPWPASAPAPPRRRRACPAAGSSRRSGAGPAAHRADRPPIGRGPTRPARAGARGRR